MGSLVKNYSKEKLTGQIFTPFFIVDKILDDLNYNSNKIPGKFILDPACGDGRFLIKIVERILKYSKKENLTENLSKVYGWDIDAEAVKEAKNKLNVLIKPLNIKVNWNLKVINSLKTDTKKHPKFDFIVGNPPYIRIQHLEINERTYIQQNYSFCKSGSTDIYIAFYELAIRLLKTTGKCAFITPNTFFQTETAKELRKYFEVSQNLIQITNYGHLQLFNNATTYSAIVIFNKKKNAQFLFQSAFNKTQFKERLIDFRELKDKIFWQLSVKKTNNKKGIRLGDIASIHVGITTLADKTYIMPFVKKENDFIYLKSLNKGIVKFEKGILKPIIKVSTLKYADEPVTEYIIFPYTKTKEKGTIIPEEILKNKFPFAYKYLLSVKDVLDKRDNGKKNTVAWYAYGRSQGLVTSFGEKILFSPMNKKPNFIFYKNPNTTFYSGYCIKYKGNYKKLLKQLNSGRMEEFIKVSARDYRGGWKAYNKKILQEFILTNSK